MTSKSLPKQATRPIRVVFALFYYEAWDALSPIYEAMRASSIFEPMVVTLSRKLTGDVGYGGEKAVHDFLTENDVAHVRLKGSDHETNLKKLKSFEPDYVFLNYPWQRNYPPAFRPDSLVKFTRIAYVPYFLLPLVNESSSDVATSGDSSISSTGSIDHAGHLFEQRTHQLASLIFVQDNASKEAFKSTSRGDSHVFVTGSPKLDVMRLKAAKIAAKRAKKQAKRAQEAGKPSASGKYALRLLWAPHHSYSPAWLNFGRFAKDCNEMLLFAQAHPEIRITLRPHPFLFGTLTDRGVMTTSALSAWLDAWKALPNTRINSKMSFLKQFASNDLLVTDGISFLAEYPLVMNKPAIFIENPDHWKFNEMGRIAADCNLRIHSVSELERIVETYLNLGMVSAFGGADRLSEFEEALSRLRSAVDPNPNETASQILGLVFSDFTSGSALVDPAQIAEVAWEDRPGREPRDD